MEDVDLTPSPVIPTEGGHQSPHEVQVKVEIAALPSPASAVSSSTAPHLPQSQETEV